MDDILEQMRTEIERESVKIAFDIDRTPREQIEHAIKSIKPRTCARHPDETLHVDIESTVSKALFHDYPHEDQRRRVDFVATYGRCHACPHDVSAHDLDVESCAVESRCFGRRWLARLDERSKPMPTSVGSIDIQPDWPARKQLADWLETSGELRCPRHNETLTRMHTSVLPAFSSWTIDVHFMQCLRCRLERTGITPDEAIASFDRFVTNPAVLKLHVETCRKFAAEPKGVLLMMGGCGTGKAHLAIAIMRQLVSRCMCDIRFIKHRRFIADHWKSLRPVPFGETAPASLLGPCQKAGLLVYDELASSPDIRLAEEDVLLDLFEHRIGNQKPSIITTNLNRAELERAIGTRLFDRLRYAAFAVLEFGFQSNRANFNAEYLNRGAKL